jgi:hypothetical protein
MGWRQLTRRHILLHHRPQRQPHQTKSTYWCHYSSEVERRGVKYRLIEKIYRSQ